jgi:hypothetical protein
MGFPAFAVGPSPNIPVYGNGYDILDRLETYGCAAPTLRAIKALAHVDMRSSLINNEDNPCHAPEWLLREANAFAILPNPPEIRVRNTDIYYDSTQLPGIQAYATPLLPFRSGMPSFNGPNLYSEISLGGYGGAEDLGIAYYANGGWMLGWDNYQSLDGRFYLKEGYLKLGYKQIELSAGRMQLEFGDAKHGDLAMSLAFDPMDALRLTLRPHVISGLDFLGYFTFDTWIAGMGNSDAVSNSALWGISIGARPATWIEIALMEVFQFGGAGPGVVPLSAADVFSMLAYVDSSQLDMERQRSMAAQISFWLPSHFLKIYQQVFFDGLSNVSSWLADDVSTLTGVWMPHIGGADIDVRIEYAHTVPSAYQSNIWSEGLTSRGTPFGSPLGPGGEGAYFDVMFPAIVGGWKSTLSVAYESRGQALTGTNVQPENRYTAGLGLSRQWEKTQLQGYFVCSQIDNKLYESGLNEQNCAAQVQIGYQLY